MLKPSGAMTKRVKILALIHIVLGGGGLATCIGLYLWMWRSSDPGNIGTLHVIGQVFFLVSAFVLMPGFVAGLGLLFRKKWATPLTIILSMLLLVLIPVGTLLGGYGLWALLSKDPASAHPPHPERPQHREQPYAPAPAQAQPPLAGQAGLLLAIVGVGASFVVVLNIGFLLAKQKAPVELSSIFVAASIVLLLVIVATVMMLRGRRGGGNGNRNGTRRDNREIALPIAHAVATESRQAARLPANWADQNIDGLVTCVHLQSVEQAMRIAGVAVRADYQQNAKANCRINLPEISRQFGGAIAAMYEERHEIDRSYLDPKTALFWCATCQSRLSVVHEEAMTPQTPWFPASLTTA